MYILKVWQVPLSVCRRRCPHSLNAWPIRVKFHMEPPWDGGTKVCSNGPGHMTKMAVTPIYGKNLKKFLLRNQKADDLQSWNVASGARVLPSLFE